MIDEWRDMDREMMLRKRTFNDMADEESQEYQRIHEERLQFSRVDIRGVGVG